MKNDNLAKATWSDKYSRWQINIQKDGIRKSFYSSIPGGKGQRECIRKADSWAKIYEESDIELCEQLYSTWINELEITTTKGHWKQYNSLWNTWINPEIGHLQITLVTEQSLQLVILAAYKKGLAKKTLQNLKSCMCAFIKFCRKSGKTQLMCENLYIPRNAKVGKRTILQPNDLSKLMNTSRVTRRGKCYIEPYIFAFRFEVMTGLRPGEVLGLKWEDIDFAEKTICINRSRNIYGDITDGKNDNAKRSFSMINTVEKILIDNILYLKDKNVNSDFVFCQLNSTPIGERNYYKRWIAFTKDCGIARVAPYELRHTFISIIKGLPEGLVKPIVGHSINFDTYNVYGHDVNGDAQRAGNLIEQRFDELLNA